MASKSSHIRSNSFPSRSHPTTLRVEEALNKITTSELSSATSESICYGLCRLAELYNSMDDVFNLPSTIQALSQQNKAAEQLLNGSVRILDICGITKEIVSQLKENIRDLQSSLRRRKGDSISMESSLNNYTCFRKKMKKDAKRSIAALKQIDQSLNDIDDRHIFSEVNAASIGVLESVLMFLCSKPKESRWSMVSRLVKVGREEEEESQNELESVDSALKNQCSNVQNKLETLEATINGVENGLEGLLRCLIKSRTSLLNLYSC